MVWVNKLHESTWSWWCNRNQTKHGNTLSLQWRHNDRDCVSNHQRLDCLLKRLFRRRSKTASKLRVTDFSEGNPPVTHEFPSQTVSDVENISIWWRHHVRNLWDASRNFGNRPLATGYWLKNGAKHWISNGDYVRCTTWPSQWLKSREIRLSLQQLFQASSTKYLKALYHWSFMRWIRQ